jgi:hypothetical protein
MCFLDKEIVLSRGGTSRGRSLRVQATTIKNSVFLGHEKSQPWAGSASV